MRHVAIISQPLRANYCHTYLTVSGGDQTIITSDPAAFDEFELDPATRVVMVSPPPELLPTRRLARGRLFRAVVTRARAGSRFGRWLERTAKRLIWRLRYVDRALVVARDMRPGTKPTVPVRESAMYEALGREHQRLSIDRLAVFDVFDLPVALAFAQDHDIEIIVR